MYIEKYIFKGAEYESGTILYFERKGDRAVGGSMCLIFWIGADFGLKLRYGGIWGGVAEGLKSQKLFLLSQLMNNSKLPSISKNQFPT